MKSLKNENNFGIILNYILIIVTNLASIILAPTLISGMGDNIYGIYLLVFQIMTFFVVADFGMGTVVIRNIVKYNNEGEKNERDKYIFKIIWLYLCFIAVVFIISAVFYFVSPSIFKNFSTADLILFKKMFIIMVLNCALLFLQNFLFAIIAGFEKFTYTRICHIVKIIIRTILFISLAFTGFDPVYLFLVDLVLNTAMLVLFYLYITRLGVNLKRAPMTLSFFLKSAKDLFFLYIVPVSENSFWTFCSIAIASVLDTGSITIFYLASTFCLIFQQIVATVSYFKIPMVTKFWISAKGGKEYCDYVYESSCFQAAFSGAVLIGYICFGGIFLDLWVGSKFSATYYVGVVMMTALFFPLSQSMLETVLYVQDKFFWRAIFMIATTLANTALIWGFLKWFGLLGGAVSAAISIILFRVIIMDIYFYKIKINFKAFVVNSAFRILPIVLPISLIGFLTVFFTNSRLIQSALGLVIFLLYLFLIYFFYLPQGQKSLIKNFLHRKIQ